MSINRYARKTDTAQPGIVDDLRKLGWVVVVIGKPVDLLVRRKAWPANVWRCLEVKTPTKTGKIVLDKRQREQIAFCADYDVPKVATLEQALRALENCP